MASACLVRCTRRGPLFPSKLANVSGAAVCASPLPLPVRTAHYPYLKVVRYSTPPSPEILSCHWRLVHTTCVAQSAQQRSLSILNPLFYINSLFHPVRPLSFESAPWQSSVLRPQRPTLEIRKGTCLGCWTPIPIMACNVSTTVASREDVVAVFQVAD